MRISWRILLWLLYGDDGEVGTDNLATLAAIAFVIGGSRYEITLLAAAVASRKGVLRTNGYAETAALTVSFVNQDFHAVPSAMTIGA
jgi:hypothetical protein